VAVATVSPERLAPVGRRVVAALAVLALPLAVIVAWAVQRGTGVAPFGSDNDEYRLVAEELLTTGRPLVAGVEATKYPIGYPLVLAAIDLVGLPVTRTAIALNVGLVVGLAAVMARLAHSVGRRTAAVPAAVYAVGGAGVWGSVYVVMPDLAFVVVTAVVVWWVGRLRTARDVWVLAALVVAASSLKSVGLLVGLAASVAVLVAAPPLRRLAWAPAVAGLATTAAMALLNLGHPEHTTGYARTFFLVDPTDATLGRVSPLGLLERIPGRAHLVLADLEAAVAGAHLAGRWSSLLAAALLAAGVWALWGVATRRAYVLAFLVIWLPAMAVWPYASVRFQLPLVVIAAAGVGGVARWLVDRAGAIGAVVVVGALSLFLVGSAAQVRADAAAESAALATVVDDMRAMTTWGAAEIPEGEAIASFAYREVAYRLDRPVVPLGYTSDLDTLLAEADDAGARWLVVMPSLYGARGQLEQRFVAAFPERLRLAHETSTVLTFRLLPPPGPGA
jgi:hypothetical protein